MENSDTLFQERKLSVQFFTRDPVKIGLSRDNMAKEDSSLLHVSADVVWHSPTLDPLLEHLQKKFPVDRTLTLFQILQVAVDFGAERVYQSAYQSGYVDGHRDGTTEGFEKGKQYADQKPNGAAIALEDEMLRVLLKHAHLRRKYDTSLPSRLIELTCYDDQDPETPLSVAEVLRIAHDTGTEDAGAASDG